MYTCRKQRSVSVALTLLNLLHNWREPRAADRGHHYTTFPGRLNSAKHPIAMNTRSWTAP